MSSVPVRYMLSALLRIKVLNSSRDVFNIVY